MATDTTADLPRNQERMATDTTADLPRNQERMATDTTADLPRKQERMATDTVGATWEPGTGQFNHGATPGTQEHEN